LRVPEEKYRTLFDSIDEGFCTIEVLFDEHGEAVDYRFLESNPTFERQTGLENAVGKTVRELAPEHEDFWFDVYGRIARTGEAIRFEHEAAALGRFYDVYAFRIGEPGEDRVPDGVETNLSATGDETAVPPVRQQTYLVMREAVRNAVAHSGCGRVAVSVDVEDGGPAAGVGLRSMRERTEMLGGRFQISSHPGRGTAVELRVPLAD
jgi:PAS domain-containing protein